MAKSMSLVWRETAAEYRYYASLALCDVARDDHLRWAEFLEYLAVKADAVPVDYSVITRDVAFLS